MKKITFLVAFFIAFVQQSNAQFTEGFETGIPATWTVINGGGANTWVQFTTAPFVITGTGSALITYNTTAHDDYLITPAITVVAGVNDRFRFKARSYDPLYPEQFDLKVSTTTPTAAAFTTTIATIAPDSNATTATDYSYDLSAYVGQTIYLGMHITTTDKWRISVDDVVNDTPPVSVPNCATSPVSSPNATCGNFSSTISWNAVATATGYNLTIGTTPGGTNILNNQNVNNVTTYTLTSQSPATTYYWTVVPYNGVGSAIGCTENSYTTAAIGCYCVSNPTSNDGSGITNVQVGTTNFPTGDVFYFDHSATAVNLAQGVNSNVQITFATGFTYDTNIWIDFNNDFDFDDAGELVLTGVASTATNPTTLNASFTMPASAPLGNHRMRIGTADDGQVPPAPCYSGTWGVTLDFTVNVVAASCTPPAATATLNSTCVSNQFYVNVNVTALGNGTPSITDGTTTWPVTATGNIQVGPFNSGSTANLTMLHGTDALCNVSLGSFTYTCPPANDNLANAQAISCGNIYTGNTTTATLDEDNAPDGFGADLDARNLWYSFTGSGTAQTVTVDLCGSGYDTSVLVYTGTPGNLTLVAANDDDNTCVSNALNSKAIFNSNGTTTYYITVEGWNATSFGAFTMNVTCQAVNPPAVSNQDCGTSLAVIVNGVDVPSDNSFGTVNATQPSCDLFGSVQDVWFSFVAPASGSVDCLITPTSMTSANFNVYSGTCGALTAVAGTCNANLTAATTENLTGLTPNETYFVQVWSNSSEQGTFSIRLTDGTLANSEFNDASFVAYPNPVKDVLNLSYDQNISTVQIINLIGQEVLRKELNVSQAQIDMTEFPSGTYLVRVTSDSQIKTIKVIKE